MQRRRVRVVAMQLWCVGGTGQSQRQLHDRPRPSHPAAKWWNPHTAPGRILPHTLCQVTLIRPPFLPTRFSAPFFFL